MLALQTKFIHKITFLNIFVFLQIYCANMGIEHGLSSWIIGAQASNE